MIYDRQVKITVGNNRKSMNWQPQVLMLPLKDIGGFVAGTLSGVRRKADAVIGRDIITLDFDSIPPHGT